MRSAAARRLASTALALRPSSPAVLDVQALGARRRLATQDPSKPPQRRQVPRAPRGSRPFAIAGGALAFAVTYFLLSPPVQADEARSEGKGKARDRLIRLSELREHGADAERIWVTRGDAVYDVRRSGDARAKPPGHRLAAVAPGRQSHAASCRGVT